MGSQGEGGGLKALLVKNTAFQSSSSSSSTSLRLVASAMGLRACDLHRSSSVGLKSFKFTPSPSKLSSAVRLTSTLSILPVLLLSRDKSSSGGTPGSKKSLSGLSLPNSRKFSYFF